MKKKHFFLFYRFIGADSLPILFLVSLINTAVVVTVGFKQEQKKSLRKLTPVYF